MAPLILKQSPYDKNSCDRILEHTVIRQHPH